MPWLYTACGHCKHCLGGWETLCESQQNTGYSVNGGFAEYVVADPNYVGHLPANVDFVEIAPVLCAGVTVYKGLKVTDTKPGDWVVISGIGGLGHMAVQYAKAMGLNVAAVDIDDAKLDLARRLGATLTVNAGDEDPAPVIKRETGGGAQGVLVTAVSRKAFEQAIGMVGRGGTVSLNGLPPGDFPLDIFGMVLNGITVRGSIVGTRLDLQELLDFAGAGKVKATVARAKLEDINDVFAADARGPDRGPHRPRPRRLTMVPEANRVSATPAALALLAEIVAEHGPVIFHQSGGCCDGSSPMCYSEGEFIVGEHDVLLGDVGDTPVYISGPQYQAWKHTTLTIDVVPGRGGMFSLDNGRERRFLTRSRLCGPPPAP